MKKLLSVIAILVSVMMVSNAALAQKKPAPWNVPANEKAVKNPVKFSDPTTNTTGKELWAKHCKSCHGAKGLGDGPKAANLKTSAGDFSSKEFQARTDGELFYMTNKGRDEMPGYDKKIPDASDRWALVNYMRTFKK